MSIMALGRNFSTKNLAWAKRGQKFKCRPLFKDPPKGPVTKIRSPALAPSRVYYGCDRAKDPHCKLRYIREDDLIKRLCEIIDQLSIDELGVRGQMDLDVDRMYRFHRDVMGIVGDFDNKELGDINTKKYMKFLLRDGNIYEQRHVLLNLKSKLILKDGNITVDKTESDEVLKDVPPVTQP